MRIINWRIRKIWEEILKETRFQKKKKLNNIQDKIAYIIRAAGHKFMEYKDFFTRPHNLQNIIIITCNNYETNFVSFIMNVKMLTII